MAYLLVLWTVLLSGCSTMGTAIDAIQDYKSQTGSCGGIDAHSTSTANIKAKGFKMKAPEIMTPEQQVAFVQTCIDYLTEK